MIHISDSAEFSNHCICLKIWLIRSMEWITRNPIFLGCWKNPKICLGLKDWPLRYLGATSIQAGMKVKGSVCFTSIMTRYLHTQVK